MPGQDRENLQSPDQEARDLSLLLSVLNSHVQVSKQQKQQSQNTHLPSLLQSVRRAAVPRQSPQCVDQSLKQTCSTAQQNQLDEAVLLQNFSLHYKSERNFSTNSHRKLFCDIFSCLTKKRLCSKDWLTQAPPENVLRVLVCLRILMRDEEFQKLFFQFEGIKSLSEYFQNVTNSYLSSADGPYSKDILKEMTSMFQKLSAVEEQREWLVACNAHKSLVLLLSANDVFVLHCCLHALIRLAQSPRPRQLIGELNSIHILLRIIQEYDTISKKLAAKLLQCLCTDAQSRDLVKQYEGAAVLLSQLHSENVQLLFHIVWCLVYLCMDDPDCCALMRQIGAIPLLLALLQEQKFVTERTDVSTGAISGTGTNGQTHPTPEDVKLVEQQYHLKSACCVVLTELVLNDTNAQQIVQANGMYVLGMLVLPPPPTLKERERKLAKKLQTNAFRALRFLFSMERNRRMFKQVFPAELFEMFIDVGHYNKNLSAYAPLVEKLNSLPENVLDEIRENIQGLNQCCKPNHYIGEYAVFELLGTGAFGSVYKVRRCTARSSFLAMKELNLQNPAFGKNAREKAQSVGEITNELRIMKESLKHPNVVRYHKTFEENDRLYIVMELIEGATLADHFHSLKEKLTKFEEHRIWNIFLQLILALRYLHKEKGIVHRDLTPNNIMLGENDKVTITDFGLAKQKRSDCSKMTSIVGTILYSCPEIVQNQPYGEKADIWALGCILYQMATLEPPFFSNNMLTLVKKIVASEYKPIPDGLYSERLTNTVRSCLTVSPEARPDVLELSGKLTDLILVYIDNLRITQAGLQRKLDRERKRTQKHFCEANRSMQGYHRLFLASQQSYDHLLSLSGSDGAQGFRDVDDNDAVFTDSPGMSPGKCSMAGDTGPSHNVAVSLTNIVLGEERSSSDRGGTTDEDSYPSSGSESRESSAGSVRSVGQRTSRPSPAAPQSPPPSSPKLLKTVRRRTTRRCALSPLVVDIPQAAKTSRDSGLSSGDPSPNASQSHGSGPSPTGTLLLEHLLTARLEGPTSRQYIYRSQSSDSSLLSVHNPKRMDSRCKNVAMLTISPNRLREISDPILQMLHQLHKIVYITQLPPTLEPNSNRFMIEQYKRALFSTKSTAVNLKSELRKLIQGSQEIIDLDLTLPDFYKRGQSTREQDICGFDPDKPVTGDYDPDYKDVGITYEHMQSVIEDTLVQCGYYDQHKGSDEHRTPHSLSPT
ncbi:hypothetical protein C0Q70_09112 [Pomacea canaliculata]|uniref:Protein kinase domain-containing protein n=1 Tax=Pomacea canaliculata TaxID=400727 RepID=A0A2T7P8W1_POMCA|nr:hypothetical protein C0Q70_09112 [Pomacea canaliculata]